MTSNDRRAQVDPESFRPSAPLGMLRLRSELLAFTRAFFRSGGFWEVETPILSRDVVVDAYLEPFVTCAQAETDCGQRGGGDELFLQTSPEFAMKRLSACGASAIFQITRAFRRGEIGQRHNPEFTIVEWYRTGATYHDQMDFVEELVTGFFERVQAVRELKPVDSPPPGREPPSRPFERLTYDRAFEQAVGHPVLGLNACDLAKLAESIGVAPPPGLAADDVDGWLNLLLALRVEPALANRPALFLYDYPPGQAALSRIRPSVPAVAERFELYLAGVEICNGYQELTDADELRRRVVVQSALRQREGSRPLPATSRLLDAMEAGLAPCAGVALGFDRLLMCAVGADSLAEVMAFPFDRA
ncbi:MAG TPA: EF-P lysine aminoacylase EpmA [Planctomycetaceae bacterium]|jgi:lysyl-tRNA synthetase class 2|nr:EF-P lysine aminoacylase EpmA [Planctomycetaceae bacterium]